MQPGKIGSSESLTGSDCLTDEGVTMSRILIVDDSPTEIHVLKTMLEKNGHQAIAANNAEEGIAKAKEEQPDLILMDVVMPGLNGFQATRQLNKDHDYGDVTQNQLAALNNAG